MEILTSNFIQKKKKKTLPFKLLEDKLRLTTFDPDVVTPYQVPRLEDDSQLVFVDQLDPLVAS
jgi:hypothetical protein